MAVFHKDLERVRGQVAHIVCRQLLEGRDKGSATAGGAYRKAVGLVLVFSRNTVAQNTQQHADRREEETEEHQPGV